MNIRYYYDRERGEPHIHRHGVRESEVEQVLARPGEDRAGYEGAPVATGKTAGGRHIRVVYIPYESAGSVFIITAFELRGKPLAAFKRRMRRRQ